MIQQPGSTEHTFLKKRILKKLRNRILERKIKRSALRYDNIFRKGLVIMNHRVRAPAEE